MFTLARALITTPPRVVTCKRIKQTGFVRLEMNVEKSKDIWFDQIQLESCSSILFLFEMSIISSLLSSVNYLWTPTTTLLLQEMEPLLHAQWPLRSVQCIR
ncbi:hypothetical protein HanXRQr2_Chr06g0246391 [Helianthus annuus]|uniref:Uncharacterized protein n=1 Tax=Helianthus annuus TaxID=4232 RepID=A0A9K3NIB1_HELAN|nr:hypothetical protein HanXRQr2_Chr06g0246391 [Helianthus annuus]